MPKEPRTPPQPPTPSGEPPQSTLLLWGLRLWILAALVIIAFAVVSYLLNWAVR